MAGVRGIKPQRSLMAGTSRIKSIMHVL